MRRFIIIFAVVFVVGGGLAAWRFMYAQPPLVLGLLAPLTGRFSDIGIDGRDGARLAVEQFNQAGGVNGRRVLLVPLDTQMDAELTRQHVDTLAARGAFAVVGGMTSQMTVVAQKQAATHQLMMLSPTAATDALTGLDDRFFRIYPSADQVGRRLAKYARSRSSRKVAVVLDEQNASFVDGVLRGFRAEYELGGGVIVKVARFSSGHQMRFSALAADVAGLSDMVLVLSGAVDMAEFAQHFRGLGEAAQLLGTEWAASHVLVESGGRWVEGAVLYRVYDSSSTSPRYLQFQKDFSARFGRMARPFAIYGYDAARVVLDALEHNPDAVDLAKTIKAVGTFAGVQGPLSFDAYGDVERQTHLVVVRRGEIVSAEAR